MKVERQKQEQKGRFSPIMITLESEDEADLLWCKLNSTILNLLESPANYRILAWRDFGSLELEMWMAFNEVHRLF